jgi:hypothetical protein
MIDPFDALLISSATILVRDAGETADAYGTSDPTFTNATPGGIYTNPVACRVSLGKGRAKQFKADKKVAINFREIFMRPWFDANGNPISTNHWLQISGVDGTNRLYQIFQVDNPGGMGHHFEVWATLYQP